MEKIIQIVNITILSILFLYIIFIICFRSQKIINDSGYYKILIFSIGIALSFISNFFITYSSYLGCSINFLFKHVGNSLSLFILYIYIIFSTELGMKNVNTKKFKFSNDEASSDSTNYNSTNYNTSNYNTSNYNTSNYNTTNYNTTNYNTTNYNTINYNSNYNNNCNNNSTCNDNTIIQNTTTVNFANEIISKKNKKRKRTDKSKLYNRISVMTVNDDIIIKVKSIRSLYIKTIFIYLMYLFFMVAIVFYLHNQYKYYENYLIKIVQDNEGNFTHQCELEKHNLIFYSISLLFYIINLIKGKRILNYNYIFRYIKYITFISFIGISFGPTTNVSSEFFINI